MRDSDLFYDQIDDATLGEDVTAYAAADHPADVGMLALELPIDDIETLEGMAEHSGQDVTEFAQGILTGIARHHVDPLGRQAAIIRNKRAMWFAGKNGASGQPKLGLREVTTSAV